MLAFVDVDDLKSINDREGHAAGDLVLKNVVATMRHTLRSYDPVVRWGGDEFLAGIGRSDLAQAEQRFLEIRAALERGAGATVSVGLAALGEDDTLDSLTARADEALTSGRRARHRRDR